MDTIATESGSLSLARSISLSTHGRIIEDRNARPHGLARSRYSKRYAHLLDDFPPGDWCDCLRSHFLVARVGFLHGACPPKWAVLRGPLMLTPTYRHPKFKLQKYFPGGCDAPPGRRTCLVHGAAAAPAALRTAPASPAPVHAPSPPYIPYVCYGQDYAMAKRSPHP
jgi:hypothetical protein